jgi:hypothetical protein
MPRGEFEFSAEQVDFASSLIQGHMARHDLLEMSADQCADLLDRSGVLPAIGHPKRGFRFRQMLRDGRDGKIPLVDGAIQSRPRTVWTVRRVIGAAKSR